MYVIKVDAKTWVAEGEGDPSRTTKLRNAQRFDTREAAEVRIKEMHPFRVVNYEIVEEPKFRIENRNAMEWTMVDIEQVKEFDYSSLPEMDGTIEGLEYEEDMSEVSKHVILLFEGYSEICVGYVAKSNENMCLYDERFFCEIDGLGSEPIANLVAWMPTPSNHAV